MSRNPRLGKVSSTLPLPKTAAGGATVEERSTDALAQTGPPASLPLEFAEIYRTFFDHVYRWIRALGGPEADREDLVQDVFLVVHRRLPDFDGDNLAGWIYRITQRRVRDFRRLHWFRVFLSSSPVDESLASSALGPEAELASRQLVAVLPRLLSKLPEAQRVAFVLFEIDGYSGEEVARFQDVPVNTVWARIQRARTRLAADITRLRWRG